MPALKCALIHHITSQGEVKQLFNPFVVHITPKCKIIRVYNNNADD